MSNNQKQDGIVDTSKYSKFESKESIDSCVLEVFDKVQVFPDKAYRLSYQLVMDSGFVGPENFTLFLTSIKNHLEIATKSNALDSNAIQKMTNVFSSENHHLAANPNRKFNKVDKKLLTEIKAFAES